MAEAMLGGILGEEDGKPELRAQTRSRCGSVRVGCGRQACRKRSRSRAHDSRVLKQAVAASRYSERAPQGRTRRARLHFLQGQAREVDLRQLDRPGRPPRQPRDTGLHITRPADGSLEARFLADLVGMYDAPLGTRQPVSSNTYTIPAAQLSLTLGEEELNVTGLLEDPKAPVILKRTSRLPTPPSRPEFPVGPSPRWKVRLGGSIFAPAATRDGVAYLGNIDGVFTAVAINDGTRLWSFAAGRPIFGEALATTDAVYFICDNGYLFRLDRATGKEIWRYDLGDARVPRVLPNPFIYDYDYWAPLPVLSDGVVFTGSGDGSMHAIRAETGGRVWRVQGSGAVRKTALVARSKGYFRK